TATCTPHHRVPGTACHIYAGIELCPVAPVWHQRGGSGLVAQPNPGCSAFICDAAVAHSEEQPGARPCAELGPTGITHLEGMEHMLNALKRKSALHTEPIRRPDFFIVGAPKSGTTALSEYLKPHPQIFIPDIKDVSFFGSDLYFTMPRITAEEYAAAFAAARDELRVGEASVWYLYSKCAAAEIKEYSPDASIIIMLRNPVDMLYAQHSEFLYNCNEDIPDFGAALEAEAERKRGRRVPARAHLVQGLFYRETARYS